MNTRILIIESKCGKVFISIKMVTSLKVNQFEKIYMPYQTLFYFFNHVMSKLY